MRRTEARENLMMLIFQMDAQQDRSEEAINAFKRNYMFESDQLGYFDTVLGRYLLNSTEIDDIIEKNSSGWHLSRMAKVDLAVSRLAVTELCFMDGAEESFRAPTGAAINEAVNLAKLYEDSATASFVNGILASFIREEKRE